MVFPSSDQVTYLDSERRLNAGVREEVYLTRPSISDDIHE